MRAAAAAAASAAEAAAEAAAARGCQKTVGWGRNITRNVLCMRDYIEGRRGGVEQLDSEFEGRREEEADFEMMVKLREVGFVNERRGR